MKKRLLLASSLLTIPALTSFVVSCSNSNKTSSNNNNVTNISPETMKIYDSLFTTTGENKAKSSIYNAKPTISKSQADVLAIAEQKLNTITSDELRQLFLNSCLKGAGKLEIYHSENVSEVCEELFDIQNFKFDSKTKEVSFDYVKKTNNYRKIIETNSTNNWSSVLVVNVKRFKVKANIYSSNEKEKVIYPVISFETEQPNVLMQYKHFNFNGSVDENFEREFWNKSNSRDAFEDFLNSKKEMFNNFNLFSRNPQIGNTNELWYVDGKFDFSIIYDYADSCSLFGGERFGFINNENGRWKAVYVYSPIFFSKLNKDGTIDWESYNLI